MREIKSLVVGAPLLTLFVWVCYWLGSLAMTEDAHPFVHFSFGLLMLLTAIGTFILSIAVGETTINWFKRNFK